MRLPGAEIALLGSVHFLRDSGGGRPVSGSLVNRQQRQACLAFERRAFQARQSLFGAVQQASLEKIQCQGVLRALLVDLAQIAAREQVLVHAHSAVVLAPPTEQIAQGKVQFRRVGIVLHGLNESVNRLVLLLVEQKIEPFEVGFGSAAVLKAQLAQVKT